MADVKFGTSGVRGAVADLTDGVCRAYISAFLRHMAETRGLKQRQNILVGRDLRSSSAPIAVAVCAEICAQGFTAENCGELPTPALAYAALTRAAPAVMVTGSHIPDDRNGLKFYRPDGEIDKDDEAAITHLLVLPPQKNENGSAAAARVCENSAAEIKAAAETLLPPESGTAKQAYIERALHILPPRALSGLHIGIYQHSCAARDILAEILSALGAKITVFARSERFIAVDTEALREEDRALARKAVEEYGLDAVVSADGDGDRPLLADEKGCFFSGDIIGILTARFLKAETVATPINSTTALEKSGFFPHIHRCRIGSPFVLAEMAKAAARGKKNIVGFEANGGFLLGSDIMLPHGAALKALPTRDALLPLISLLALAQQRRQPLSALRGLLPPRRTAAGRLQNYPPLAAQYLLAQLGQAAARAELLAALGDIAGCDSTDGLRFQFASGDILHFRCSGNAPELRCYSEAETAARAAELLQAGLDIARQAAGNG